MGGGRGFDKKLNNDAFAIYADEQHWRTDGWIERVEGLNIVLCGRDTNRANPVPVPLASFKIGIIMFFHRSNSKWWLDAFQYCGNKNWWGVASTPFIFIPFYFSFSTYYSSYHTLSSFDSNSFPYSFFFHVSFFLRLLSYIFFFSFLSSHFPPTFFLIFRIQFLSLLFIDNLMFLFH